MPESSRINELHLTHLRSFCQVAMRSSYAAAAAELQLSTPTVWQQVRALEKSLGVRLLVHLKRKTTLTPEGQLLWNLARGHVSGLDSLPQLFHKNRRHLAPSVTLAAPQGIVNFYLPGALRAFRQRWPEARLKILIDSWPERLVEDGTVELAVRDLDPTLSGSAMLAYDILFHQRLSLITPGRHPLNRRRRLEPADLVRFPFVRAAPDGIPDRALQQWLNRHGLADRIQSCAETFFLETMARLIAEGIGIGAHHMHPSAAAKLAGCHVRPLPEPPPDIVVALVTRRAAHLSAAAELLRSLIRAALTEPEFQPPGPSSP